MVRRFAKPARAQGDSRDHSPCTDGAWADEACTDGEQVARSNKQDQLGAQYGRSIVDKRAIDQIDRSRRAWLSRMGAGCAWGAVATLATIGSVRALPVVASATPVPWLPPVASSGSSSSSSSSSADMWSADRTSAPAAARRDARIICLDWRLTEMLVSIGVVPVGSANPNGFRAQFPASPLPHTVVDVGLIFRPNLELMRALKPDVIIATPAHASLKASLERVAPVLTVGSVTTERPFRAATMDLITLATTLGRVDEAHTAIRTADETIEGQRQRLTELRKHLDHPILIARLTDPLWIRVYGETSLFGDVLTRLGLANAWAGEVNGAGFANVQLDALANTPDAVLAYFGPLPGEITHAMEHNALWRALPFNRPGRMVGIHAAPPNGGVATAALFATTLAQALLELTMTGGTQAPIVGPISTGHRQASTGLTSTGSTQGSRINFTSTGLAQS